jgi:hypothetical protein
LYSSLLRYEYKFVCLRAYGFKKKSNTSAPSSILLSKPQFIARPLSPTRTRSSFASVIDLRPVLPAAGGKRVRTGSSAPVARIQPSSRRSAYPSPVATAPYPPSLSFTRAPPVPSALCHGQPLCSTTCARRSFPKFLASPSIFFNFPNYFDPARVILFLFASDTISFLNSLPIDPAYSFQGNLL